MFVCRSAHIATIWYRRLAHLALDGMHKTVKAVVGMELPVGEIDGLRAAPCTPCLRGRVTSAPFPSSTSRMCRLLEQIHSYKLGPMEARIAGVRHYFVSVIDNFIQFTALVPVKEKGLAKIAVIGVVNK